MGLMSAVSRVLVLFFITGLLVFLQISFTPSAGCGASGDRAWEYSRMMGDEVVDHGKLSISNTGTVVHATNKSSSGGYIHFSMIKYSAEQLAPPEPNTCRNIPNPDMGDEPYFFGWNVHEGKLCVKQVEAGEWWVFRVGGLVVEKHFPVEPPDPPVPLQFVYREGERIIKDGGFEVNAGSMGNQVCDGHDGLPVSQVLYLGAAMNEKELPQGFPADTVWFEANLPPELGVFKIWPLIPGAVLDISIGDQEFQFIAPVQEYVIPSDSAATE